MTEKEYKDCLLTAEILKSVSRLGYGLIFTLPFFSYCFFKELGNTIALILPVLGILSGVFIGFRAWHLYFDSRILKNIAENNQDTESLDLVLFLIFNKKTASEKDMQTRIKNCCRLAKTFFYSVYFHILIFLALLLLLVIK